MQLEVNQKTGHFAIETHGDEIATAMLEFLQRSVKP
jgi:hypothetical protein